VPVAGQTWEPQGKARCQPHEYERNGTAKLLTLFHPATGQVRAKGVTSATNAVLHPWLQGELEQVLAALPAVTMPEAERPPLAQWQTWEEWPSLHRSPLRLILVWDNLAGHLSPELVIWLYQQGVLPLYTPLSGSWLNMAESLQRIVVRRALGGQHPQTPDQIITWLEETVAGWNAAPTPFTWHGKRYERRRRARARRHQRLAGSGAACFSPSSFAR
jgi:DDE superfamily endonuclease